MPSNPKPKTNDLRPLIGGDESQRSMRVRARSARYERNRPEACLASSGSMNVDARGQFDIFEAGNFDDPALRLSRRKLKRVGTRDLVAGKTKACERVAQRSE